MHPIIAKTRENYNIIARHFARTRKKPWAEFEYFKTFIKNGQNILDWGCGNGRLLDSLAGKNVKYFGVDISDELIKIAKKEYAEEIKSGKAKFYRVYNKKFPANFFDLEFMVASFFHLPDERRRGRLLDKMFRELKPKGRLIILVWNLGSEWARFRAKNDWQKVGQRDFFIPWKNAAGEIMCYRYYHHFTENELAGLLSDAGFKIQKMAYSKGTLSDEKGGRNLMVIAAK